MMWDVLHHSVRLEGPFRVAVLYHVVYEGDVVLLVLLIPFKASLQMAQTCFGEFPIMR